MSHRHPDVPATDVPADPARRPSTRHELALQTLSRAAQVLVLIVPVIIALILFVDRPVAEAWSTSDEEALYRFLDTAEELGDARWYLVPGFVLAAAFYLARSAKWRVPLYIALSVGVSGIVVNILKVFFGRNRPNKFIGDNEYGFHFFEFGYSTSSFPSGHTTTAFAAAVALGILMPRFRVVWWTIGAAVAMGRVATGSHFPSDVVAGAWLGSITALVLAIYVLREPEGDSSDRAPDETVAVSASKQRGLSSPSR